MASCRSLVLLALAIGSVCAGFKPFATDKEVVYDYKALVKAGTHIPVEYGSVFYLHGKLHLQLFSSHAYVKLTDLTFKLYNGEIHHDFMYDLEKVPITDETKDLMKPFKIHYNETGKAVGITTEEDEHEWTRNIKKAIASILQLDMEHIKMDAVKPYAFSTTEHSIYGKSYTLYDVEPEHDHKELTVTKMHEMHNTKHMYQTMMTNRQHEHCEAPYEEPFTHDSQREYKFKKVDDKWTLAHIYAWGGLYSYPMKAKSELHYVYINQTFDRIESFPIKEQFKITKEHHDDELTYHMDLESEHGAVPDVTSGRRHIDQTKTSEKVYSMVHDMVHYLKENHIHDKVPDIEKGQMVNRVLRLFVVLDTPTLEKLHKTFVSKTSEEDKYALTVFYELLPLVGSEASMHLIKTLVHKKEVTDKVAKEMVEHMAFYVKVPSEKMLHDMEDMIHWGDEVTWEIRKMAVLSFATLMYKTYHFQHKIHSSHHHHFEHHEPTEFKSLHEYWKNHKTEPFWLKKTDKYFNIYDKYVTEFVDKLKTAKDFDTKMLYITALHNTKLDSVVKYLMHIVKGEWFDDHKIQRLAMFPLGYLIGRDSETTFEVFWPIFTDYSEHVDMRIIAYLVLMKSHPSASRLNNIYWFLEDEPNHDLYHFHYNFLKHWAKTVDPCHEHFKLYAQQTLKFMRKPVHHGWMSTYHLMDYKDPEYGFGGSFENMFINTNTSVLYKYESKSQLFNMPMPNEAVFVSIHGLDERLLSKFHLKTDSPNSFFNFEELWNHIKSIPDMKHVNIKVIFAKNGFIVRSYYIDPKNINLLTHVFDFFTKKEYTKNEHHLHIEYNLFTKIFMPTELGTLAVMDMLMPVVEHDKTDIKKETVNDVVKVHMDSYRHVWRHSRFGLSFYNPFADIWQGINRYTSYDAAYPMYMDVGYNPEKHTMKMVWKRHKDPKKDIIGARAHATNLVFAKDDFGHKFLKRCCAKCKDFTVVSKGDEFRHDYKLLDSEGYNTGYHYYMEIFDSEHHITNSTWKKFNSIIAMPWTKNYDTPLGYFMLFMRNWYMRAIVQPKPGRSGSVIMYTPSTEHPVTEVDLSVRFNQEYKHEKDEFMPGMKFNTRVTYSVKNEEKPLKTWDVSGSWDINPGHTLKNWKMQITRIIPGQKDYNMCFDGTKKWTHEGVNGHFTVGMTQSTEGKCGKDDTIMDVTMVGKKLKEQDSPHHEYGICSPYMHKGVLDYHHLGCAAAHTSIRKYTYDVKTQHFPQEFKKYIVNWWDSMKAWYMPHYTYIDEHHDTIEENNFKVEVVYPMVGYEVDVHMKTPHHEYVFSGIPFQHWTYFGVWPDNTQYSKMFMFMHMMGLTKTCTIYPHKIDYNHYKYIDFEVPKDWTPFVTDQEKDAHHGLWVKHIDGSDKIAFKVAHGEHFVEVHPVGKHFEDYKFVIDGKEIKDHDDHHHADWFSWVYLKDYDHKVVFTTHHYHMHIVYDGYHLYAEMPKLDQEFHGHCFDK